MRRSAGTRREDVPESILDISGRQFVVRRQARVDGGQVAQSIEEDRGLTIVLQRVRSGEAHLRQGSDRGHGVPQIARGYVSRMVEVVADQIIEQQTVDSSAYEAVVGTMLGVAWQAGEVDGDKGDIVGITCGEARLFRRFPDRDLPAAE